MGFTVPSMVRSSVVLPDPDGPTTPRKSPCPTWQSTLRRTGPPPNPQVTSCTRSRASFTASLRVLGGVRGHVPHGELLQGRGVAAEGFDHGHVVEAHEAHPGVLGLPGLAG